MAVKTKVTASLIEKCRLRFEAGDKAAVPDAMDLCARAGLAMPVWLAEAFCAGYTAWATYEVRSLDEALGVVRKGRRRPDLQKAYAAKAAVVMEVNRVHQEGIPIEEALFEQVGKTLNIATGQVRALFYEDNPWRQFFEALNKLPSADAAASTRDGDNNPSNSVGHEPNSN